MAVNEDAKAANDEKNADLERYAKAMEEAGWQPLVDIFGNLWGWSRTVTVWKKRSFVEKTQRIEHHEAFGIWRASGNTPAPF